MGVWEYGGMGVRTPNLPNGNKSKSKDRTAEPEHATPSAQGRSTPIPPYSHTPIPGAIATLWAAGAALLTVRFLRGCRRPAVLQRLAVILFWPHPLIHQLDRELARAREEVCDNFVLRRTAAPAYARTLLQVAESVQGKRGNEGDGGMGKRVLVSPHFPISSGLR